MWAKEAELGWQTMVDQVRVRVRFVCVKGKLRSQFRGANGVFMTKVSPI